MRPGLRDEKSLCASVEGWVPGLDIPEKTSQEALLSKVITNESEVPGLRQTHPTERSGGDENS